MQRQPKPFPRYILYHPELHEYLTKELYSGDPSLPGHWRNQGRVENIVTFPNAEKFLPVDRRTVSAPIQRLKPRLLRVMANLKPLLIEPVMHPNGKDAEASQLTEIWPTIKKGNCPYLAQGRIEKDLVMLITPKKTILKKKKSTIHTISSY